MNTYEILIVGGGGLGIQIANRLAQLGFGSIGLVEKNLLAHGMSAKAGAMFHTFHNHPTLSDLALESQSLYSRDSELTTTGSFTFLSKPQLHKARQELRRLQRRGAQLSLFSAKAAREVFPQFTWNANDHVVYEPEAGTFNSPCFSKRLATSTLRQGLSIHENLEALDFLREGHKIVGIRTNDGDIKARLTIVTAGTHTIKMLHSLGIGLDISILPTQLHEYEFKQNAESPLPMVFEKRHSHFAKFETVEAVDSSARTRLSLFIPDLSLRLGCGETLSKETIAAQQALSKLSQNFPEVLNAEWKRGSCVFDVNRNDQPGTLGFVPGYQGLYSVFGWGKNGLNMAPAIAREVSRQVSRALSPASGRDKVSPPLQRQPFNHSLNVG